MSHYKLSEIEEELQTYGINRQYHRQTNRWEWKLICRGVDSRNTCGTELILRWGAGTQAGTMIRDAQQKGWLVGRGERPMCPTCQRAISRKAKELSKPAPKAVVPPALITPHTPEEDPFEQPPMEPPMDQTDTAQIVASPPPVEIEPLKTTVPSPKIARAVHELLGEFFDEMAGAYRGGYDDERIAQEVGCHVKIVIDARIGAYGELVEDTRISALRADIDALDKAFVRVAKTANDDIAALRNRLEQLAMNLRR